jgi:hypothetical protein
MGRPVPITHHATPRCVVTLWDMGEGKYYVSILLEVRPPVENLRTDPVPYAEAMAAYQALVALVGGGGPDDSDESDIIAAGRRVPFVQTGMIVHPDDCLNCERGGHPLWCSPIVSNIRDDDERWGMTATLLYRTGEVREEPCQELRRRWRLARDFDQTRVYTGRWGAVPRGGVWPVAEVEEWA